MSRVRMLGFGALLLAIPAAAQQPAGTAQIAVANPISESFKGFGFYGSWLVSAFDSIPASKYDFKPTPIQQSVGYIAQHLEDANYQLCSIIGGVSRATTSKDSFADTVKAQWPKDTLVARLRKSLEFCRDAFANVTDAKLAEEVSGPAGSGRRAFRARYVMLFITDLVDHYSQIANYMRIMGMIPPSALPQRR